MFFTGQEYYTPILYVIEIEVQISQYLTSHKNAGYIEGPRVCDLILPQGDNSKCFIVYTCMWDILHPCICDASAAHMYQINFFIMFKEFGQGLHAGVANSSSD